MARSVTFATATLAFATALVCGVSGLASASPTPHQAAAPATSSVRAGVSRRTAAPPGPRERLTTCLEQHKVPKARLTAAIGLSTGQVPAVSAATLKSAGLACQHLVPNSENETLQRLDTCIGEHHVKTAHTGSPLADLLLLDPTSSTVKTARETCLPIAEGTTTSTSGKTGAAAVSETPGARVRRGT